MQGERLFLSIEFKWRRTRLRNKVTASRTCRGVGLVRVSKMLVAQGEVLFFEYRKLSIRDGIARRDVDGLAGFLSIGVGVGRGSVLLSIKIGVSIADKSIRSSCGGNAGLVGVSLLSRATIEFIECQNWSIGTRARRQ